MLRTLLALTTAAALAAIACKNEGSSSPGACEPGYVMTRGNVCVTQNIADYDQCVESTAARENIDVGLTKEILEHLQLVFVEPGIGATPEARGKAAQFIAQNMDSCRELEVVWGCYLAANKVQEDARLPPICTPGHPVRSARAGMALVWRVVAPDEMRDGHRARAFADAEGVWRCAEDNCERWAWRDAAYIQRKLPCATDASNPSLFAWSQGGLHVAQVCGRELKITTLDSHAVVTRALPFPVLDLLVVDDRGVVTATEQAFDDRGKRTHKQNVARVTERGVTSRFSLVLPSLSRAPDVPAELWPANGRWLAYTHGAYANEVAWRASTPPAAVELKGGAIFNGDRMWVSLMTGGYVHMSDEGPVPVPGKISGAWMGHGLLCDPYPWGDGLIVQYEYGAQLKDAELMTRREIDLPTDPKMLVPGQVGSDPSGRYLYYMHHDGRILAADLCQLDDGASVSATCARAD